MDDATQTDGALADGEPVFRLVYRSHSLIAPEDRSTQLASIFTTARQSNRGRGITGALIVTEGAFVQALEGEESEVRDLFDTIRADGRHSDVSVLQEGSAARTFGRWAMAQVSARGSADIRLLSNARRGEIVTAGKDPSITSAQEEVLAFMRGEIGSVAS